MSWFVWRGVTDRVDFSFPHFSKRFLELRFNSRFKEAGVFRIIMLVRKSIYLFCRTANITIIIMRFVVVAMITPYFIICFFAQEFAVT